jgi:hypothetical protein
MPQLATAGRLTCEGEVKDAARDGGDANGVSHSASTVHGQEVSSLLQRAAAQQPGIQTPKRPLASGHQLFLELQGGAKAG